MPGTVRVGRNLRVVGKLEQLLRKYPDLRVMQLLLNAIPPDKRPDEGTASLYYMEDEALLDALNDYEERVAEAAKTSAASRIFT